MKQAIYRWMPTVYVCSLAVIMLGYVRYDPYQLDGDAVTYMDLASAILHGRWHSIVNGLWNPGYPALLALGKWISGADRMHELQVFYWVNYCIFLGSLACTAFFVQSLLHIRDLTNADPADEKTWALGRQLLYVAAYSVVFVSWQQEFSMGKIRVDGLFASLLLLAFGFLLRFAFSGSRASAACLGLTLGLAYLVKSPGLIFAIVALTVVAIFFVMQSSPASSKRRLLLVAIFFGVVAGPYITALSIQKGRLDFGDSASLNYAWYVADTGAPHLLNNQQWRFGNARVDLKHPEIGILSDPVVVFFPGFPHVTYASWFDPSYFNDGIHPYFQLSAQLRIWRQQSKRFLAFILAHSIFIALILFGFSCGIRPVQTGPLRRMLILLCGVFLFAAAMYLSVHFLDRYIAGLFWIAWIAWLGLSVTQDANPRGCHRMEGATIFLAIGVALLAVQTLVQMREEVILSGNQYGWYNAEEFRTAQQLAKDGVAPGTDVACFWACGAGPYWARLASLHVTSEIFDPRSMGHGKAPDQTWAKLQNKEAVYRALRSVGAKGIVGYFNAPAPLGEGWQLLAGHYYWMPLQAISPPQSTP